MEVRVLGSGCPKCHALAARTRDALTVLGIDAEVVEERDPVAIATAGIMATPALEVDGNVLVAGRVPDVDHLTELLRAQAA